MIRKNPSGKVLFISHDAHRHGAEILFLHFLKWFRANTDIPFRFLLKNGGELVPEFEALGPVDVWGMKTPDSLVHELRRADIGLIYSNTFTNGPLLEGLSGLGCPVLTHVHELHYWITYRLGQDNNEKVVAHTDRYIACSQAVRDNLVESFGIPEGRIDVIHGFIPTKAYDGGSFRAEYARLRIRRELGIPDDAFIVGCVGTTDWRKGGDLFAPLAKALGKRPGMGTYHCLWVGTEAKWQERYGALMHDVTRLGLQDRISFAGAHPNTLDYFSLFDVFVLLSREDPYPLVNLEAASLGKPIVCFDKSGGSPEFIEDDCGFIVPYLDIDAMADKVVQLAASPELRMKMGERAQAKVRERHELESAAPKIVSVIRKVMSPAAAEAMR